MSDGLLLTTQALDGNGEVEMTVSVDGVTLHRARLNLAKAADRHHFYDEVLTAAPDIDTKRLATEIARIAAQSKSNDAHQADAAAEADGSGVAPLDLPSGRTEMSNGQRLIAKHGVDLRWCDPWNKSLAWDGKRWAIDQQRVVESLAKSVIQGLWTDLAGLIRSGVSGDDAVKPILSFLKASGSAHGIDAMIRLARSEPGIPILPAALDKDPWLLNCANGTLDLRSGVLRAHRREDYLTKLCPVAYDPDADCPLWHSFLGRVVPDADLRSFLRRAIGMSLSGVVRDHVLMFLYGTGANGKTTLVNTILAVLGENYALKAAPDLLMVKRGEAHPTERADLAGKRFIACVESEENRRLAEGMVKELTGNDPMRVRRMYEDYWTFYPTHKVWLASNHKPVIRGTDYAIWRRVKLIPFTVQIPPEEQDPELPDKLKGELSGILNWAMLGLTEWLQGGLQEPEAVRLATDEYRSEEDTLAEFLDEKCVVGPEWRSSASDLYKAFAEWCKQGGEYQVSSNKFGRALTERGFQRVHSGKKWWQGIGLKGEL